MRNVEQLQVNECTYLARVPRDCPIRLTVVLPAHPVNLYAGRGTAVGTYDGRVMPDCPAYLTRFLLTNPANVQNLEQLLLQLLAHTSVLRELRLTVPPV